MSSKPNKSKQSKSKSDRKKQPMPQTLSSFHASRDRLRHTLVKGVESETFVDIKNFKIPTGMLRDETPRSKVASSEPSAAADFLDPRTTYTFMLKGFSTLTANSSGVVSSFFPFDPTSTGYNFSEWASLSSLFSEFRLKSFHVQFVPLTLTTLSTASPVGIGSNLSYSNAPATISVVINQADGIFWNGGSDHTSLGYTHRVKPGSPLGWSSVSSPTNTPYAGAPGCLQIYNTSNPSSLALYQCRVMGVYELRVRS